MSSSYNKLISSVRTSLLSHTLSNYTFYLIFLVGKRSYIFPMKIFCKRKIVKMSTTTARDCADYSNPNESFWYSYWEDDNFSNTADIQNKISLHSFLLSGQKEKIIIFHIEQISLPLQALHLTLFK